MTKLIKFVKGTLRKSDHLRPLLTDTSPYEVPIIFSNDGFYRNLKNLGNRTSAYSTIVQTLITENQTHYTIPLRYNIAKDEVSVRNLSLPHPHAQHQVCLFYKDFETLIPYYCGVGKFSIRRPTKSGSTFYFRSDLSDENAYKRSSIDTDELDKITRNPASYFTYAGYPRLYKFFGSREYLRLERKFAHMHHLDVSKCFASIYTHSVSWAIKGDQHSKDNRRAVTFGSRFDELMQKMNYNETAGICIGPEVSRIFSEVILNRVDPIIEASAAECGMRVGQDFDCKRYVDDYIFFVNDEAKAAKFTRIVATSLSTFKLNLNEQKIRVYGRPFLTEKSHTVLASHSALQDFLAGFLDDSGNVIFPRRIFRMHGILHSFLNALKVACVEREVSYDSIANYVIAVLVKRVERVIRDFPQATGDLQVERSLYPPALRVMLEAAFFLYTVNPTVASSYALSRAILASYAHVRHEHTDDSASFLEAVLLWGRQLTASLVERQDIAHGVVPIEAINIILACAEIDPDFVLEERHLRLLGISIRSADYFSLITGLYLAKDGAQGAAVRSLIVRRAREIISGGQSILKDSEKAHLVLDFLSCPHVDVAARLAVLTETLTSLNINLPTGLDVSALLSEFVANPWFVDWGGINLLAMVRKKELSSVY